VEYDDGDSEEYNFKEIQRMAEQVRKSFTSLLKIFVENWSI
jgi:hypothetical protein